MLQIYHTKYVPSSLPTIDSLLFDTIKNINDDMQLLVSVSVLAWCSNKPFFNEPQTKKAVFVGRVTADRAMPRHIKYKSCYIIDGFNIIYRLQVYRVGHKFPYIGNINILYWTAAFIYIMCSI